MPGLKEMLSAAAQARANAYAPYSEFAVGAAALDSRGRVSGGCNVENASYGLSCCAERNAIAAAVVAGMRKGELRSILVLSGSTPPATPCGACRQVIAEFAAPECMVICANADDEVHEYRADQLLPEAFSL